MTATEGPIGRTTAAVEREGPDELTPSSEFLRTALPGFRLALEARRSIRVFDGEPLPEDLMRGCLRDATLAPTSSNLQPYELVWVRDPDVKAQLAEACMRQSAATTAGELVVVLARGDLWRSRLDRLVELMTHGGTRELPHPFDDYYRTLVPKLMRTDALGANDLVRRAYFWWKGRHEPMVRTPVNRGDHRVWAHVQAALVAQTLMISVAAHGFDSCPIGGFDARRVRRLLDFPRRAEVAMVIAIGRRRPEGLYGPRTRLPEGELIREL